MICNHPNPERERAGGLIAPPSLIFLLLAAMAFTCGCNRPLWEKKSAERQERIHKHVCWYAKHDAAGKERLDTMSNRMEKHRCAHEEHLEKTRSLVRREMESDRRRWCEERPKRRAFARREWCGDPDSIPGTWAKMMY